MKLIAFSAVAMLLPLWVSPTAQAGPAASTGATSQPVNQSGAAAILLDRTYLLGRWTDIGDCTRAIEFTHDGRFRNPNKSGGLWDLEGDRLTLSGRRTSTIRLTPIDQDTVSVTNTDGSLGRSTRCGSAVSSADHPQAPQVNSAYLVGRWTDNGDCTVAVDFAQDGSFSRHSGRGRWNLTDDRLTMSGASSTTMRVRPIDQNTLIVINSVGALGRSTRC